MAWIKRNLVFVITVVVGLGVAGYCGYLFYSAFSDKGTASDEFNTSKSSLTDLEKLNPYPSKDNITAAEADAVRVRAFLDEFRKPFSGFPIPPKMDDHQFHDYLQKMVVQFGAEATNAGVGMSAGYAFGFLQQVSQFNYAPESIAGWMGELEEINAILQIFYKAKINFLEKIKRPSVAQEDVGDDIIQFPTNAQPWGVISPYRVEFRAFSAEIADVLAGIAASSNCFIVKAIYIKPSTVPIEYHEPPPPEVKQPQPIYRPPPRVDNPFGPEGGPRSRGERPPMRPPPMQQPQYSATPAAPTGPVTILREVPLFVTLYLDVVKLKAADKPAEATARPPARGRPPER